MRNTPIISWVGLLLLSLSLACATGRQPRQAGEVEQLVFEIQTATATVSLLVGAPTHTPDPNATATATATPTLMATEVVTPVLATATIETQQLVSSPAGEPEASPSPLPAPPVALAAPIQGGAWDFEDGFNSWVNPFGDSCNGSGLANGWSAGLYCRV